MTNSDSISRQIRQRLAEVRRLKLAVEALSGFLGWLVVVVFFVLVLSISEAVFHFTSSVRTVLALLGLAGILAGFLWLVARPVLRFFGLIRTPSDFDLAGLVGSHFPTVRDRLLNLLELHEEAVRGTLYSPELIDASFQDFSETIQPLDFREAVDRAPVRSAIKAASAALTAAAITLALFPSAVSNAGHRLVFFSRAFTVPPEFRFHISPGNREILKGETVPLRVQVLTAGNDPVSEGSLTLFWRPEGQTDFELRELLPDSGRQFTTELEAIRLSTVYFAEFRGVESERYLLSVIDRPIIRSLRVRLEYPEYSHLPPTLQEEFAGNITALAGTEVRIQGSSNKDLVSGSILFQNDISTPLSISGTGFSGRFVLRSEGSYRIALTDTRNLQNHDPVSYDLRIIPDVPPAVAVLRPGRNLDIAGTSSLPLLLEIKDDFGFSALRLGYRLAHSRFEQPSASFSFIDVPLPGQTATQAEIPYDWDLTSLRLVPEDIVEYFAEVADNDRVGGPKIARSKVFTIRLPSLEEVFTDLDEGHQKSLEELTRTVQEARELRESLESIQKDLKTNTPLDWRQQKQLEEASRTYDEVLSKLDETRKQLDQLMEQMQQHQVLSSETLEKYMELQQLFEQLNSDELQKILREMQRAVQGLNKQQLQQALQQFTFSEQRFRESIERTLDLLKRIHIEQKLDELLKRTLELAQKQEELRQRASGAEDPATREELATRQEELARDSERLQEAAEDVQNRMEEFFTEMPERELQEANARLQEQRVGERMRQAGRRLRQNPANAQQLQQQIQADLQNYADQLGAIQMQMQQAQQQFAIQELRRAVNNLLELSKRQEDLKEQSKSAPANSPQLRQNAQEQLRVMLDLQNVASALQELSQRSFAVSPAMGKSIGEALARMQQAMSALDTRTGATASQEQGAAMSALNRSAMQVQGALQALMQAGGSGGGLMGQLQSLAGQQLDLNMRTQTAQDAARLAVEQEAIRKSLEQLNTEARAAGEADRILGDLDVVAKEMQEVVREMEQNNVNPETIRRQERILSRLLDAARSTRERDFEKKRRAETGTQVARRSPRNLDPSVLEGADKLREDLLRALEQGYSKDYEELIRKYFEALQKLEPR